jgi:hypothetical protein
MNAFDHAIAPILPVLLTVAGLGCIAGILRAAAIIPLHVSLDPNEGWNAYHAAAAMRGHGLYPGAASFMANNYPPLSFYLVGLLGQVTGDPIVAGRIVSLAAFVCICGGIVLTVRGLCGGLQDAVFSAILFAALLLLTSDYVGMDDPQLLGHALQLAGLLLVLREPRTLAPMFAASLLFVLGGFVKHSLFVLPLAMIVWLALIDRRNALRLAVPCLALTLFGLGLFRLYFGFNLFDHLASARLWSLAQFQSSLATWLPYLVIPLIGVTGLILWHPRDRSVWFVAIYTDLALVTGAFMAGGAGVDVNAMFDADIALTLAAGLALGRLLEERKPLLHVVGRAFALAALVPFALPALDNHDWRDWSFWLHPMRDETSLAAEDIGFLRAHAGAAICESLALCYWAGKSDPVDVFNLDQQFRTGTRDTGPFLRLIEGHHYAAMEFDETDPFPLPRTVQSAILYNYRIDRSDDEGTFLVPRS